MSDVRDELIDVVVGCRNCPNAQSVADAILERFDVTPKPVVRNDVLGLIVLQAEAYSNIVERVGFKANLLLKEHGLKIVRVDE